MRSWKIVAAASAALAIPIPASANLSISKLWVDFKEGDQERSDLVIRNDSQDRYYVAVTVAEIVDAGTELENKLVETDPDKLGLLVTPNQIVLEPGAIRSIRLVSLNKSLTRDRVYRVLVAPQVGALKVKDAGAENRGVAIKMLAAYDVLVIDRPKASEAKVEAQRLPGQVILTNSGNSNVLVAEGFVCPGEVRTNPDKERCKPLEAQRLYAGNTMSVSLDQPSDRLFLKTKAGSDTPPVDREF
ncbi:P pilus assembly chaperone PapD [Sphingopyxis italica]|uniref:P pilus assembly chaperone PapD n=1 Tax=Sphingopyxis italica TaxID=1129133 RepID=A0A7X6B898_9SPHN|nr:hypothetical protein [Sphingopyxis italica]NJB89525.1 P pilus assembly chaperone PapD [Sphingopyxis italica]